MQPILDFFATPAGVALITAVLTAIAGLIGSTHPRAAALLQRLIDLWGRTHPLSTAARYAAFPPPRPTRLGAVLLLALLLSGPAYSQCPGGVCPVGPAIAARITLAPAAEYGACRDTVDAGGRAVLVVGGSAAEATAYRVPSGFLKGYADGIYDCYHDGREAVMARRADVIRQVQYGSPFGYGFGGGGCPGGQCPAR